MLFVSRASWGARSATSRTPLDRAVQRGTAVHYSAADADEQADHARCPGRVQGIQDFHMDAKGWADIAYSYLSCKHGSVFEGRGRGVRTAAQGTTVGNDAWHAVCFLGDDTAGHDDVTDAGRQAIRDAVAWCNAWSGSSGVRPHSDFHATGCPGDELRAWIAAGMPVLEEGFVMALSDAEQREVLAAARQINGAVGAGQASFAGTVEATLATTQALVNLVKAGQGSLAGGIADVRSAVLGAIAALPAPETPEQAAATRDQVLGALANLGVEGLSPDALLDALHARLAA